MILECRGDIISEWGATSPGISTLASLRDANGSLWLARFRF